MHSSHAMHRARWLFVLLLPLADARAQCAGVQCELRIRASAIPQFVEAPVSAARELVLGDKVEIRGEREGFGAVSNVGQATTIGSFTKVGGAFSGGDLLLGEHASISNDIMAANVLPAARQAERARRKAPESSYTSFTWTVRFPAPAQAAAIAAPALPANLAPGYYRELRINPGSVATLRTGTYYFDNLLVGRGGRLHLDNRAGTVVIHVRDILAHEGSLEFDGARSDVLVNYFGVRRVELASKFDGSLIAPNATLVVRAVRGVHEGMFYADIVRIDSGTLIKKTMISNRGPAIARFRPQMTDSAAGAANVVTQSDNENGGMPFPDTPAGRVLNDYFIAANAIGPDSLANYAEAQRQLHANADLVMPLLMSQYDALPHTVDTQMRRLTLVDMMRGVSDPVAYDTLVSIATMPIDPAIAAMQGDEHFQPSRYEEIIRARAVNGIGNVARTGDADATRFLLDTAVHGTGLSQLYAAREYLATGDREAHRATLRESLPAPQQYLAAQDAPPTGND